MVYFTDDTFMILPENIDSIFIAKNDRYVLCIESKADVCHSFTSLKLMDDDDVLDTLELPPYEDYKTDFETKTKNLKEGFAHLMKMYRRAISLM